MMKPFQIQDTLSRLKRTLTTRSGSGRGVLLISAGGLGDTVLFSLFAGRFAAIAPDGEPVTVLLRSDAAKMGFLFPENVRLEIVNFKDFRKSLRYRRRVARRLYKAHYRLVISTDHLRHPDLDEALIEMAEADEAIAMEPRSWAKHNTALNNNRRLYARLFDSGPDQLDKVLRWNGFFNWILQTDAPPPKVHLDIQTPDVPTDYKFSDILIQPFSAVYAKQSPVQLYHRILDALPEGTHVALTGAPGDLASNIEYKQLLQRPGVIFDSAFFQDMVPAIKAAKLVISVDTAMMHLAVVLGTPTLCLASAAYVGEIVPYAPEVTPENAHFIYQSMDCEGCLGNCSKEFISDMYPCVAALDKDQVVNKVKELLKI